MNFECWATGTWAAGSWVEGSWCPGATPTPAPQVGGMYAYQPWTFVRDEEEELLILALTETLPNE